MRKLRAFEIIHLGNIGEPEDTKIPEGKGFSPNLGPHSYSSMDRAPKLLLNSIGHNSDSGSSISLLRIASPGLYSSEPA